MISIFIFSPSTDPVGCRPCGPFRKLKSIEKKVRHPCDDSEECEDPCEALFGERISVSIQDAGC